MKTFFRILICLLLIAIVSVSFAGCSKKETVSIRYGEKYIYGMKESSSTAKGYYVFNEDNTGYYELHENDPDNETRYSGRAYFVWRLVDGNSLFLFPTEVVYDDDHTEGNEFYFLSQMVLGEDFIYSTLNRFYYIAEGSELDNLIKNDIV